ncbi:MAG: carboxypeptidase M32 [Erysipelotrichia bacterium]|nr:carboxypeptidase M32 [Erysipelotrichia bacterium]NCC55283.1 carboxypeptidase M32 [Erysipelotrichia bacterium]
MNQDLLKFYEEYKAKTNAYALAMSTLYFDQATIAPKDGAYYANQAMAILAGENYSIATNPEAIKNIEQLAKEEDLTPELKKELSLLLNDLEEERNVPKDVFVAFTKAVADSESAWQKAKAKKDYQIFKPYLKEVIEKQKEVLSYSKKAMTPYDILLDRFQLGMNSEKYDAFFDKIKSDLIPFIKTIQEKGKKIDDSLLFTKFDVKEQEKFMEELKQYMNVNTQECYMGTSEHPFTSFFSAHDVRITTHYYENNVMSAILSTIHEYGHALYGLQVNKAYDGTTLSNDIGFAMHESQSRFMENHIGRSKAFWQVNYPKLQSHFKQLEEVSLDQFMEMINVSYPSLIRTEADELTYPLHILIRYELEKEIFNENIDFETLDRLWADKYEQYLGIRPNDDSEGILQDMHWGAANLGYFPTYALGSAFAAQFYHQLEKEIDVESALKNNEFYKISDWLKTNIHQYGAFKDADTLLLEVTKEPFNPQYYIDYLIEKFKKVYHV